MYYSDKMEDIKYLMKLITDEPHWHYDDTLRTVHDHLERYCEEIDESRKGEEVVVDINKQSNYQHRFFFDERDSEEDCIERIQRLIDMIYMLNPNLDYDFRPHIYLKLNGDETESEKLESNVKESITNTPNDITLKINIDTTEAIQQLKRIQKALITDEQLEQFKQELREYGEENIYQKNTPSNHNLLPKAEKEQLEKIKNGEIKNLCDLRMRRI